MERSKFKPAWAKIVRPPVSKPRQRQTQWLTSVITATQKAEIRKIKFKGAKRSKYLISANGWHPGMYLSSQLCREGQEEGGPGQPRHRVRPYLKNN
jgi:hypothetical protein